MAFNDAEAVTSRLLTILCQYGLLPPAKIVIRYDTPGTGEPNLARASRMRLLCIGPTGPRSIFII